MNQEETEFVEKFMKKHEQLFEDLGKEIKNFN